ncbi:hypothetical protein JSCD14_00720 [Clostridioides difficile]|nr:hypothetical protein TNHP173_19450 [Clostridioides difficile]GMK60423.1 hypothetical protein JSCD1_03040 [Clostridioides difficile]GMK65319.1 hypothetical protein JSCD2_16500 [Clostridioides difficile]GMK68896.1 hypothetical protein JSCD3_16900 [Clostridioides difficile]GMK71889.1 hypothetical protein JSCD4_10560 [Clostridioides difficile]
MLMNYTNFVPLLKYCLIKINKNLKTVGYKKLTVFYCFYICDKIDTCHLECDNIVVV